MTTRSARRSTPMSSPDDMELQRETSKASPHLNDEAYSAFSQKDAILVVVLIAIAGFFSPFTAFIYFPTLESISSDFGVSIELMNITVTVYLIVQGIIPPVLGDLSENLGRRPVYLLAFALYCAASIGLALQRSYPALLVLRMLQSAGSSGAIALAYGVIGDIAAPHERGLYVGTSVVGFNSAPALGPVIGGLLADRAGWSWIFVFLAAFSGALLVCLVLFLPETARKIVGNGSIPPQGLNRTLVQIIRNGGKCSSGTRAKFCVPDILPCLKLIFHKDTFSVLLSNATFYMMYSCLQATTAPLLQQHYGMTPLQAGLCYLSYGVAGAVASVRAPFTKYGHILTNRQYAIGMVTDRDYCITAKQHNFSIDRLRGDNMLQFPIEKARLRSIWMSVLFMLHQHSLHC